MMSRSESSHSQKRRILKNTAANGVAQAVSMISTFIFLPLLVRDFGVSAYGVLALSMSVSAYALLLDLGVSAALVRLVAERTARDDGRGIASAIFSATTIYGALGVFVAGLMVLLGLGAGEIFNVSQAEATLLTTLLWVGALHHLLYWPALTARDALAGLQRYDLISGVTLATVAIDVAGTIYVLATGSSPVVLVVIRLAAMVLASCAHVTLLARLLPSEARRITASVTDMRAILRSGSSVFVLQIAQVMSRQQTDKLVLGIFAGTAAVTLYDIAAKLNSLVTSIAGLATSAVLPVAAQLNAREEHGSLREMFLRGTKLIATALAPVTAIMIAIAAPFIAAWFGPGFEDAVPVAQLLLLSQVFLPLYQLGDPILIGRDRFGLWVPGGLTLAILNVALSVVLVQGFGVMGVALGTLVAVMLELPWYMRVFGREMSIPAGEWLRRTAWPAYPLLVVPAVVAYLAGMTVRGGSLAGLFAVGVVALALYWATMLAVGYSREERLEMVSVLRSSTGEVGS